MLLLHIYIGILLFFLGACMGSFVTCAADRYHARESVLHGRSRCPACGKTLGFTELIPVLSYVFLRGRCRSCGAPIPVKCLFTELLGGLVYCTVFWKFGLHFITLEYLLVCTALLAIALIDADSMEIPDGLLLFLVLVFAAFFYPHGGTETRAKDALWGALAIGGGMLLLSLLMDFVTRRETLGGGDVKLFFVLALFTGVAQGLVLVLFSCVAGLVCSRRAGRKDGQFAFAPAIAVAAFFTLLLGGELVDLYWNLIL